MSKPRLGRGLSSLIPDDLIAGTSPTAEPARLRQVPIDEVHPNPEQPRTRFDKAELDSLAESIRSHGVLQPLLVRRHDGRYLLLAGERRLRAAALAGLHEVPVVVHEAASAERQLELALVENLQRTDLDPVEEARGYARLVADFGRTQAQVAVLVGKARVTVTNAIRLLKLPEPVLSVIQQGRITAGHARALVPVAEDPALENLVAKIEAESLSVRDTERMVAAWLEREERARRAADKSARRESVAHLGELLGRRLHTEVRLEPRADGGGKIVVEYGSEEELTRLVEVLKR